MDNFNNLVSGIPEPEDLVKPTAGPTSSATCSSACVRAAGRHQPEGIGKVMELADFDKMEQIRARVDQIVQDPVMAEALKPWYRQFCKRPCFHDDYLPTFNRPNVTLVDTDGKGVERITEHSVWANGVEYPVDCLIYATGFEVGTDYARRAGYEVHGRDGVTLTEKWADGAVHVPGLPLTRLPQLLHRQRRAVGLLGELPAHARRAGQAPRLPARPRRGRGRHACRGRRRRPRTRGCRPSSRWRSST
jgi:hypothetical protein